MIGYPKPSALPFELAPVWLRRRLDRCDECARKLVNGVCPEVQRQRDVYDAAFAEYVRTGDKGLKPIWTRP